ncbi:unnamed protein product [Symbiodinium pilosum]|uniref:Uncharacterized protein n=1 Tax=Symbiodinium pilosum TaxID=2952 RepID=A0A812QG15_SYMPI|nr:unnamed protein product [Symbiodinium pilosum]
MTQMPKEAEGSIDPKLPWWGGDWTTFQDYSLRVELKADATKKEDLPQLGPRLATNLIGKAFDVLGSLDREALKKEDGWSYLLKHLEKTRGKTKVDVLGDAFAELFVRKDVYRRDGEEMSDYESRYRALVRKVEKALTAVASGNKMPSEVFGWFLLNIFIRLDTSDTANVKAKAATYALDDVLSALSTMWSGGSLAQRDAELKRRRKETGSYLCEDQGENEVFQTEAQSWQDDDAEDDDMDALDRARPARGYYPAKNPNYRRSGTKGKGKGAGKGQGRGGEAHFVRYTVLVPPIEDEIDGMETREIHAWLLEENLDDVFEEAIEDEPNAVHVVSCMQVEGLSQEPQPLAPVMSATSSGKACAIIDSGASENIVGKDTLQELADHLQELDFDPSAELR